MARADIQTVAGARQRAPAIRAERVRKRLVRLMEPVVETEGVVALNPGFFTVHRARIAAGLRAKSKVAAKSKAAKS